MLPNTKELKKIAATCRKMGIKHFRCEGFEFTLTDEDPSEVRANASRPQSALDIMNSAVADSITTDSLTEDELLMWSVGDQAEENKGTA